MATSITALTMRIGADTSALDKAASDMRKTMRTVGQVLRAAETPQQRLEKQTAALEDALNAGRISWDQYAAGLAHVKSEMRKLEDANKQALALAAEKEFAADVAKLNKEREKSVSRMQAYIQKTRETEAASRRAAGGVGMLASKFGFMLKTLLPIATAGGLLFSLRRSMQGIDEAAKAATAIGDTVTNYMALAHALGEVTGMAEGQAANALKVMNMQLSQAAMFGGRGADAIARLGLRIDTLMAMRPAERFTTLVDAIASHNNEMERGAIAQAVFGRAAKDVMTAVNAGRGVLGGAAQAAKDLGLAIGEDQAKAIERANDAIARMRKAWQVALGGIVAALEPMVTGVVKIAESTIRWANGLSASTKITVAMSAAVVGLTIAIQALAKASAIALAFTGPKGWAILAGGALAATAATYGLNKAFGDVAKTQEEVLKNNDRLSGSVTRFAKPVAEVSDEYLKQRGELEKQLQILNLGEDAYQRMMDYRKGFNQAEVQTLQNLRDEIRMVEQRQKREQEIARLRKQAADAFTREAESALSAARRSLELEKQKAAEMRRHMQSSPASIGVGSAEAAAFLAEQANAARGLQAGQDVTPGEKEIIAEAQRQLELQRQQLAEDKRMVAEIIRLQRVTEASATRRVR